MSQHLDWNLNAFLYTASIGLYITQLLRRCLMNSGLFFSSSLISATQTESPDDQS